MIRFSVAFSNNPSLVLCTRYRGSARVRNLQSGIEEGDKGGGKHGEDA